MKFFRFRNIFIFCLGVYLIIQVIDILFPFPLQKLKDQEKNHARLILDSDNDIIDYRISPQQNICFPIQLDKISPWLIKATLAAEDQSFYHHSGINYSSLARALTQNIRHRERVSGASTITMQLVRLVHKQSRTWPQKAKESWQALQLEEILSKDEILSHYLNLAPYGGNLVGIEAASRLYFNKAAKDLTLAEAALLAGLPQSPSRYNPKKHLKRALVRRDYVFQRMLDLQWCTKNEISKARKQRIIIHNSKDIDRNPIFGEQLLAICPKNKSQLRTTIRKETQTILNHQVRHYKDQYQELNIDGLAVVVIDVENSELIGLASGLSNNTMLNLAHQKRQPASTLKPFLYAKAYERGWLTPEKTIDDQSKFWGSYRPRNADHRFMESLPAMDALKRSRNIPAVHIIHRLGPNSFLKTLNQLNLQIPQSSEDLGLSLALGTPECRLINLSNAYACLVRNGNYTKLKFLKENINYKKHKVFSDHAAALTLHSLGARQKDSGYDHAYKTGTSWQQRDAWAFVMGPSKVVGVWVGLLSGQGHDDLTGSSMAYPLARDILLQISDDRETWNNLKHLRRRKVCSESGAPPAIHCKQWKWGHYIPGRSSDLSCRQKHQNKKVQEISTTITQESLIIQSPIPSSEYIINSHKKEEQTLPIKLKKNCKEKLFWFINGKLVKETNHLSHAWNWKMQQGEYHLLVCNDKGDGSEVHFKVSKF